MRTKIEKLAMVIAGAVALAVLLIFAGPAQANVRCDQEPDSPSWEASCFRRTVDNDAGGVSGFAQIQSTRTSERAGISFQARGEDFHLWNETGRRAYFSAFRRAGTGWDTVFKMVPLNEDQELDIPKSYVENVTIDAQVCIDWGGAAGFQCARLSSFRT